jgi:hypothetical protein
MNDQQLQKEIEEALAIEPTSHFLARVRRAVETGKQRSAARVKWASAAAGMAAVAVVIGIMVLEPSRPITLESTTPLEAVVLSPAVVTPMPLPLPKATPKPTTIDASRHSAESEVLIDEREVAALRNFLQDVQERKIDPARLEGLFESAERARTTAVAPMPIAAIEPIVIAPLGSATSETGGDL